MLVQLDGWPRALGTAYVIALVLHLNPHLPLNPARLPPLVTTVGLFYVVHLTVIFYILLVLRQLLAREIFSPAWISVGVLVWLSAVVSAAGAALMWTQPRHARARARRHDGARRSIAARSC